MSENKPTRRVNRIKIERLPKDRARFTGEKRLIEDMFNQCNPSPDDEDLFESDELQAILDRYDRIKFFRLSPHHRVFARFCVEYQGEVSSEKTAFDHICEVFASDPWFPRYNIVFDLPLSSSAKND